MLSYNLKFDVVVVVVAEGCCKNSPISPASLTISSCWANWFANCGFGWAEIPVIESMKDTFLELLEPSDLDEDFFRSIIGLDNTEVNGKLWLEATKKIREINLAVLVL